MHWKKTFAIPDEPKLSENSKDILRKLITDSDTRLGRNGCDEIKAHPFFDGMDWNGLRDLVPPYIPEIKSEISNENFDAFDEEDPFHKKDDKHKKIGSRKVDINFVGYTYKADVEAEKSMLVNVLKELDSVSNQQFEQNDQNHNQQTDERQEIGYDQNMPNQDSYMNESEYSKQNPFFVQRSDANKMPQNTPDE